MGCCCCRDDSKEGDNYQSFNGKEQTPNYGTADKENEEVDDAESVLSSASRTKNDSQLITDSTKEKWNMSQTEKLERELEKQIIIQQYKHSSDKTVLVHEVDEVLEDSLSMSISEQKDVSKSKSPDEGSGFDDGADDSSRNRRPSSLFRYTSKKKWDQNDLDEQENSMQRQMDFLVEQTRAPDDS